MAQRSSQGNVSSHIGDSAELVGEMEQWPIALAVIRHGGALRFANAAARELLTHWKLTRQNGQGEWLLRQRSELSKALAAGQNELTVQRRGLAGSISIALFQGDSNHDHIVVLRQNSPKQELASDVPESFGLTAAESDVLTALIDGDSVAAIAEKRQTSQNTIRSQLKAIFKKTSTHRQSELMKLCIEKTSG